MFSFFGERGVGGSKFFFGFPRFGGKTCKPFRQGGGAPTWFQIQIHDAVGLQGMGAVNIAMQYGLIPEQAGERRARARRS